MTVLQRIVLVSLLVVPIVMAGQDNTKLKITEIMYDPPDNGLTPGSEYEFIEIKNVGSVPLSLTGMSFNSGVVYGFPPTTLQAGQFFVIASNSTEFQAKYSFAANGQYTKRLSNGGEALTLVDNLLNVITSVTYNNNDPWPLTPNGAGFSLVRTDPNAAGDPNLPTNWRASGNIKGSPKLDDPEPAAVPPVILNEVLTNSNLPLVDFIEIYNPTSNSVSIADWYLSDSLTTAKKYKILGSDSRATLGPGGYSVFTEADFNVSASAIVPFSLSSHGESVYIFSGDANGQLTGYSSGFSFGESAADVSFARYRDSVGITRIAAQTARTPEAPNAGPAVGPIVINEVNYFPKVGDFEFVELKNITPNAVKLYDPDFPANVWKLSGTGVTISANTEIPPFGLLIVTAANATTFRNKYGVPADVQIIGPYPGTLQDTGEFLKLERPDLPYFDLILMQTVVPYVLVDGVHFSNTTPWPSSPAGTGPTLERISPAEFGDEPANWRASAATAGTPGVQFPPNISIGAAYSGSETAGTVSALVSLSDGTSKTVTVHYETSNGSAIDGEDYTASSGTVTLAPGELSKSIVISILNDSAFENDETFTITISTPSNAVLTPGAATSTLTITSDDPPPPISISGTVTFNSNGLQDVVVSDGTRNATTNAQGQYTLANVPAGPFTIRPTLSGYIFTPATRTGTSNGIDLTAQNFTAQGNIPPGISSSVTATPNPGVINESIAFSVVAADSEPLSYEWNFGDGATATTASGSTTHQYASAGTFNAVVTVRDTGNLTAQSNVSVVIDVDTDSDGIGDQQEKQLGTNPNNPNSKPNGTADFDQDTVKDHIDTDDDNDLVSDTQEIVDGTNPYSAASVHLNPLTVTKAQGAYKAQPNKDTFAISGTIANAPAMPNPKGQEVLFRLGGAAGNFTLDAKGKAKAANGTLALKFSPVAKHPTEKGGVSFPGGTITFTVSMKNGSWSDDWADEGILLTATESKVSHTFVVDARINGVVYGATITVSNTCKAGKGGSFKK